MHQREQPRAAAVYRARLFEHRQQRGSIFEGAPARERGDHVVARVAVGYGKYVEVVDLIRVGLEVGEPARKHLAQHVSVYRSFVHNILCYVEPESADPIYNTTIPHAAPNIKKIDTIVTNEYDIATIYA